jgi:DNA-binding transcriptional LysR family regulator
LPKLSKNLFDRFPDLQLTIYFGETPQAISWLKDASIDIAILPRRTHLNFPEFCEYYPTFFYQPALITPKNHPLANKKISQFKKSLNTTSFFLLPNSSLFQISTKFFQKNYKPKN